MSSKPVDNGDAMWVTDNYDCLVAAYHGEWIVVVNCRVCGHDRNLEAAVAMARRDALWVDDPYIEYMPDDRTGFVIIARAHICRAQERTP